MSIDSRQLQSREESTDSQAAGTHLAVDASSRKAVNHASGAIETRGLRVSYGDRRIIEDLSVEIPGGAVTCIIGANGCGKSTLLRALARIIPSQGSISIGGRDLNSMKNREVASLIGLLPQSPVSPPGLSVRDLVARGRHPHQRWFAQWSEADEQAVDEALRAAGVEDLANRAVDSLSGGQRQRVWIALVLAQNTDVLFLDEPTTYLDLAHSIEVLDVIDRLCHEEGRTIVMVVHDLNLALRYADNMIVMADGEIAAEGDASTIVNSQLLHSAFGLKAIVIDDPLCEGKKLIVPAPAQNQ